VGRALVLAAIQRARALGADSLILATSPLLEAANQLYRSVGFVPAPADVFGPMPYIRHSIVMEMDLAAGSK
jgi:GNAT superfamily N-acetyltransferase